MILPPLCKSLALYNVLEERGVLDSGLLLREVERLWPATGLPLDALHEALADAACNGEFQIIADVRGARVRAAAFEERRLNPSTLVEIDELVQAYELLHAVQLAVVQNAAAAAKPADCAGG